VGEVIRRKAGRRVRNERDSVSSVAAVVAAQRAVGRARRHFPGSQTVSGRPSRPRLVVTRSLRQITAQIVDERREAIRMAPG